MLSNRQITIHWITQLILIALIRWIVIYPTDSAILRWPFEQLGPGDVKLRSLSLSTRKVKKTSGVDTVAVNG